MCIKENKIRLSILASQNNNNDNKFKKIDSRLKYCDAPTVSPVKSSDITMAVAFCLVGLFKLRAVFHRALFLNLLDDWENNFIVIG